MEPPSLAVFLHWFQLIVSFYNLYVQNAWPFGPSTNVADLGFAPVKMHMSGSHSTQVPADRAVLSINIKAEGSSQQRVADEIKASQDNIMDMLRPLSEAPFEVVASGETNFTQHQTGQVSESAIVNLGVNTFNAASPYSQQTIFGEKPIYVAKVDVQAEFASLEALGYVIAKLLRTPRVRIESLMWKLSDDSKAAALSKCQRGAAQNLGGKAVDFATTLGLPNVRPVSINERPHSNRVDRIRMRGRNMFEHDEYDMLTTATEPLPTYQERTQFEARTLQFEVELDGEFQAW